MEVPDIKSTVLICSMQRNLSSSCPCEARRRLIDIGNQKKSWPCNGKADSLTMSNIVKLWQNMTVSVDLTASNIIRLWRNMSFCVNYLLNAMSNLCLCKRHLSLLPLKMALSMSWSQGELALDAAKWESPSTFSNNLEKMRRRHSLSRVGWKSP